MSVNSFWMLSTCSFSSPPTGVEGLFPSSRTFTLSIRSSTSPRTSSRAASSLGVSSRPCTRAAISDTSLRSASRPSPASFPESFGRSAPNAVIFAINSSTSWRTSSSPSGSFSSTAPTRKLKALIPLLTPANSSRKAAKSFPKAGRWPCASNEPTLLLRVPSSSRRAATSFPSGSAEAAAGTTLCLLRPSTCLFTSAICASTASTWPLSSPTSADVSGAGAGLALTDCNLPSTLTRRLATEAVTSSTCAVNRRSAAVMARSESASACSTSGEMPCSTSPPPVPATASASRRSRRSRSSSSKGAHRSSMTRSIGLSSL
mmetsp:Transcript_25209/g.63297  ORF Transcript_25209/g.63297 Transcript_25209/m.63297 type:complete len:317 (-) Transcript_25209:1131-2081(-)